MKRFSGLLLALVVSAVAALAQTSPSVVGTWDMVVESPQGKRPSTLIIKQEGDKLSAVVKGARGERPLDSISLKGDEITMVMKVQFQGSDMVITYTGKVEKEMMKGKADFGGLAEGEWSATPQKEGAGTGTGTGAGSGAGAGSGSGTGSGAGSITGTWNGTVETSQGTGSPTFTFKQEGEKLTGNYKGQLGEAPLTGTLKGNDISFSFKLNFQGEDVTITYTGKVEGNNMKGKAMLGQLGEANWTAKKQ
ncbi:MAG TPA: hypothetical protein VF131_10805 [Blastocatellia bacterium]|nr:hypothetical protein [Blastocatellia bacterium]